MKRCMNIAAATVLLMCHAAVYGQEQRDDYAAGKAFLALTGALYAEDMGEEEVERLDALRSHPLKINLVSRSRLVESGLFTPYQAASVIDYRNRNGDILSAAELAAVDGFSIESVAVYLPFISFESFALPGKSSDRASYMDNSIVFRSAVKLQGIFFGRCCPDI